MRQVTVTSSPLGFRWMDRNAKGWDRMWATLHGRRGTDPGWQYMGTEPKPDVHVFRLREGEPRYERIPVDLDDFDRKKGNTR